MLGIAPATAASAVGQGDLHVTRIVVEPSGPDMNFTVYFESSFFTRIFSLIFGAKVLQPSVESIFANFNNVSVLSIDSGSEVARVAVRNMSTLSGDGWYLYNGSTTFAAMADVVEVHNPDGRVVAANNSNTLPAVFNRVPAFNKT